jgi:crotonobetainyl-CoA:carnitine CoA-transferase CaiB-like acyl-CoA transferase
MSQNQPKLRSKSPMKSALEGVRILDISRFIAGPFCAQILGDMGAEVIKVEGSEGEPARHISPIVHGESLYFLTYNRSKKGVTINVRHPKGQALLKELMAKSDILIENFRPGVMDKMGLDAETIEKEYPHLIHATVLGFGREGPYSGLPCFDEIGSAMGGLMSICGWSDGPPTLPGTYVADLSSGLYLAIGILLSLRVREKTGRGQKVDVALINSVFSLLHSALPELHLLGKVMSRIGNQNRGIAPGNAYKAKDGYIVIEAITQGMWESLVKLFGKTELLQDPRYKNPSERKKHADSIDAIVAEWVKTHNVQALFKLLSEAGIACGPVQDISQVVNDPQLKSNGQIAFVKHEKLDEVPLAGVVVKLSHTPGQIQAPPPMLGQHNRQVFMDLLGYSGEEINALSKEGAI